MEKKPWVKDAALGLIGLFVMGALVLAVAGGGVFALSWVWSSPLGQGAVAVFAAAVATEQAITSALFSVRGLLFVAVVLLIAIYRRLGKIERDLKS